MRSWSYRKHKQAAQYIITLCLICYSRVSKRPWNVFGNSALQPYWSGFLKALADNEMNQWRQLEIESILSRLCPGLTDGCSFWSVLETDRHPHNRATQISSQMLTLPFSCCVMSPCLPQFQPRHLTGSHLLGIPNPPSIVMRELDLDTSLREQIIVWDNGLNSLAAPAKKLKGVLPLR